MSYKECWRDQARHVANACFIGSYICLTNNMMILGSLFTIVGESLLAPSALKQRSWSTLLVCSVFLTLAFATIARSLLGGN